MKKACLLGKLDKREEENFRRELQARGYVFTDSSKNADLAVYTGGLDEALTALEGTSARTLAPFSVWMEEELGVPPSDKDERSLGKIKFEREGVTEVSKKVSTLIDKIPASDRQFSEIKRFLLGNGIELAQNALIHRKLSGEDGTAQMELFEGQESYRLEV